MKAHGPTTFIGGTPKAPACQIQSEKEIQNATTKISHRLDSAGHERQDCSTGRSLSPRLHPSFACSVAQRARGYVGRVA